jgi:rhamnosyltransferase
VKTALIVPTLNAGTGWGRWLDVVLAQGLAAENILVVDSSSTDGTAAIARERGVTVKQIARAEFDHGGTRQQALELVADADIIVFMTQDALPAEAQAVTTLCEVFTDPTVGAAFGRQLPHPSSGVLGAHARLFNYGPQSYVRRAADIPRHGIKAAFISNSFAAYRRVALEQVGGFPARLILGEDMVVAARMLLDGWSVAYCAEAKAYHSHDYTMGQEFRRYFDIGVFHAREPWLLTSFGKPEGEGGRFVRSELRYVWRNAPWLIPSGGLRTILKYAGYRLGRMEQRLPLWLKSRCSMHKGFWSKR